MKKIFILSLSAVSLFFTPIQAEEAIPVDASFTHAEKAISYSSLYQTIHSVSEDLGGRTENNLRYSILSQILSLGLDNEQTVVTLENIRTIALKEGDLLTVRVIESLLVANEDENSDIAAIFAGRQGLPPIPTPPSSTFQNSSTSDY